MNDQSNGQKLFLTRLRRHRITVLISRVLILTVFLFLWELCARFEIIDSFIFSSPSKITLCFFEMLKNRSLFLHIGITLYETFISFILVILLSILAAILLWYSKKLSEILEPYLVVLNSLPKSALAPLLIVWLGATSKTIIIAGMSVAIFGSILNLYTAFINVDQETDIYTARKPQACAYKSCTAFLCSGNHKQYESQYRTLSCGSHYRRISRCQKRTWISDHLFQSGI